VNITLGIVFVGYYLNVYIQSSDPRLPLQDGHDEASGSSSEVDDTAETKVLVISSSDRSSVRESNVSENELLLQDIGIDCCVNEVVLGIFSFCPHTHNRASACHYNPLKK